MVFMMKTRRVLRIDLKRREKVEKEDIVVVDKPTNIFVDGRHYVTLMGSPKNIRELAIGHLLGEGIIGALEDLEGVRVRGVNVYLKIKGGANLEAAKLSRVITTACGVTDIELGELNIPRPKSTEFRAGDISNALESLLSSTKVFRKTGGTHAAAIFTQGGELKFCMEDVGRHNAVDKVIGRGLIEGTDFTKSFLVSTGRLSGDVVVKCARAGIPLVASKAAPMETGILAAEMFGLTLLGFVRGSRLNVYTNPKRVKS